MTSGVSSVGHSNKVSAVRADSDGFGIISYRRKTTIFSLRVKAVKHRHQPRIDVWISASLHLENGKAECFLAQFPYFEK
jgi:hypothetical protein